MSQLPSFIGLGAPKCATTYLDSQLRRLDDVYLPLEKEPNFFSNAYWRGMAQYEEFFEDAEPGKIIGEMSTSYFHHSEAPARIKEHCPDAKFIISVRNPVEQVYSMYWQAKRHNFYQNKKNAVDSSFDEALDQFPDVLKAPAQYGTNFQHWLQYFDRERFFIVLQQEVRRDFPALFERLCDFIGAQPPPEAFYQQSNQRVFSGVSPRGSAAARLYGAAYKVLNKGVFFPLKNTLGYKRAHYIKERLKVRAILGKVFFRSGYPPITDEIKASIRSFSDAEVELFEELTGVDLSEWK